MSDGDPTGDGAIYRGKEETVYILRVTFGSQHLLFVDFLLSLFILQFTIGRLHIILPYDTHSVCIPHSIHPSVKPSLYFSVHICSLEVLMYGVDLSEREGFIYSISGNLGLTLDNSCDLGCFSFHQFTPCGRQTYSHWFLS